MPVYIAAIYKYTLIKQSFKLSTISSDNIHANLFINNVRLSTILILEHNFEHNR